MAVTALPRSPVNTASAPLSGWNADTSRAETSAVAFSPLVERSTTQGCGPAATTRSREGEFGGLGVGRSRDVDAAFHAAAPPSRSARRRNLDVEHRPLLDEGGVRPTHAARQ